MAHHQKYVHGVLHIFCNDIPFLDSLSDDPFLSQIHLVVIEKMVPKILAISNNRTDTRIYVRGDKTINYGRVLEVMGMLSGAGFSKVALISEPYKNIEQKHIYA